MLGVVAGRTRLGAFVPLHVRCPVLFAGLQPDLFVAAARFAGQGYSSLEGRRADDLAHHA